MTGRFHVTDTKYIEYREVAIRRALTERRTSQREVEFLEAFISDIKASSKSLSMGRAYKITYILIGAHSFLPQPYHEASIGDVKAAIASIKEYDGYTKNTKSDYYF